MFQLYYFFPLIRKTSMIASSIKISIYVGITCEEQKTKQSHELKWTLIFCHFNAASVCRLFDAFNNNIKSSERERRRIKRKKIILLSEEALQWKINILCGWWLLYLKEYIHFIYLLMPSLNTHYRPSVA